MADDSGQGPKIASIDELVNELTKKNSSPPTPPPSGGSPVVPRPIPPVSVPVPEIPKPKFTVPPTEFPNRQPVSTSGGPSGATGSPTPRPSPVMPRPAPTPAPLPKPPIIPIPAPVPAAPAPAKPSIPPVGGPVKEYQSSIRTMKDDISTLKQGQKPAGVDVPRIIQPPAPPSAPVAPKPPLPTGGPGQQFKMPSVNLGQAEKTGPLPQTKEPTPPAGKPAPVPQKSQIYAPPLSMGGISGSRNRLFGIIAGAVVLFGVLYWFLVLRVPEPEIVLETPTPTPVATPVQNLNSIFADATEIEPVAQINGGEFRRDGQLFKTPGLKAKLLEIIEGVGGKYPTDIPGILGEDAMVLWYGQKELFDKKGQLKVEMLPERRLATINEIIDMASALQSLSSWESSMSEDLKFLLTTDKTPGYNGGMVAVDFMDNFYRGVGIRYKNFPYADTSIDYAIVNAPNGKNYLVITGSRESMFAAIDALMGTP